MGVTPQPVAMAGPAKMVADLRDCLGSCIQGCMPREEFQSLIDSALRGELTREDARQFVKLGPEVVVLALLTASRRIAEQDAQLAVLESKGCSGRPSPSSTFGKVPVYAKPNKSKRRK